MKAIKTIMTTSVILFSTGLITQAQNDLTGDDWTMSGPHIVTQSEFVDRVGIGTQNPLAKLHITDVDPDESALKIYRDQTICCPTFGNFIDISLKLSSLPGAGVEPTFQIDEDGEIGLGTKNPDAMLHIKKNTSGAPYFTDYLFKIESKDDNYTAFGTTNTGVTHVGTPYTDPSVNLATRSLFEVWSTTNTALDMSSNFLSSFRNWSGDGRVMRLKGGWAHSSNYTPIFQVEANGNYDENVRFRVLANGKVAIGGLNMNLNTTYDYGLYVQDGILTERLRVSVLNSSDWADYVFADDYELTPLSDVEAFIDENNHLPGIPSAQEVVESGVDVAEMDALLLEKIEELTLYMISLEKRNTQLEKAIQKLTEESNK